MTIKKILIFIFYCLVAVVCALIYFVALKVFIQQSGNMILSGGVMGISIVIARFTTNNIDIQNQIISVVYIILNIPLFILGWLYIGKKFTIFSAINVIMSSLLINIIPLAQINALQITDTGLTLEQWCQDPTNILSLTIIAGVISGISTGIAFKMNISGGGMDFLVLYLAIKKGLNSGRYMKIINITIVTIGAVILKQPLALFYTLIYIIVSAGIVDMIHIKNRKIVLTCITTMPDEVSAAFIANSMHGCTILKGKGAYTGDPKYLLHMVVSSFEMTKVIRLIKEADPNSFIYVNSALFVSGRFYIPPLE